jgi:AcrR family transcriptional regulator
MSHGNARLAPAGRLILRQRIQSGRAVAHVAAEMGISRTTAWRWWRRFRGHGPAGLQDRSSVARSHPRRTGPCLETRVRIMRELTRRGPVLIAGKLGMHASTVGRVLRRHRAPLLRELDPVTGAVIRATRRTAERYEHDHPGHWIRLCPHRDRRPLLTRLRGSPRRRTCPHQRRIPRTRNLVLRHCRRHRPTRPHRQRGRIPPLAGLPRRDRRARHHTQVHPSALPLDQRQSRAIEPHPRRRMGLRPTVHLEHRTNHRVARLAGLLQPRQAPPRHRRHTHRPHQQRSRSVHLGRYPVALTNLARGSVTIVASIAKLSMVIGCYGTSRRPGCGRQKSRPS